MSQSQDPQRLVRRFARHAAALLAPQERLLCAVSGGSDSMALLHLLLASTLVRPDQLLVAHFNHNLRPEATKDADFVATQAKNLGVDCTIGQWSPPTPFHDNLPALARAARYDFLIAHATKRHANQVLTAHQQDDQAETLLERLLRGSGVRGLSAIRPRRPLAPGLELLRPLLPFGRQELRTWLQQQGIPWRDDPSNASLLRRRNRLRHTVLPLLQESESSNPVAGLAATAQRLQQADTALTWVCRELWRSLNPQRTAESVLLTCASLTPLPDELQIRLLQQACHDLECAPHPPGARALEAVIRLLAQPRRRWTMRIHGASVTREQDKLVITRTKSAPRGLLKGNS